MNAGTWVAIIAAVIAAVAVYFNGQYTRAAERAARAAEEQTKIQQQLRYLRGNRERRQMAVGVHQHCDNQVISGKVFENMVEARASPGMTDDSMSCQTPQARAHAVVDEGSVR